MTARMTLELKLKVISWFEERGMSIHPDCLKDWHWENGKLWFVISGTDELFITNTDEGHADLTLTHREDGSPILCYELYDSVPIEESPLRCESNPIPRSCDVSRVLG